MFDEKICVTRKTSEKKLNKTLRKLFFENNGTDYVTKVVGF